MSESKAMQEIHEIRERHYEKTKDMSSEEFNLSIKVCAEKAKKRIEVIRKSKQQAG